MQIRNFTNTKLDAIKVDSCNLETKDGEYNNIQQSFDLKPDNII